jgi:hypothetical protein
MAALLQKKDEESAAAAAATSAAAAAKLRAKVTPIVHRCKDYDGTEKWCWSDPNNILLKDGSGPCATKEEAFREAIGFARDGLAFR